MKTKMIFLTLFLTSGVVSLRAGQSDFKSYINGTSNAPTTHDTWGVFLGLTQSDSNIDDYIREQISLGKWINPFTGQPLPSKRGVFVFGQDNPALELLRGITDHVDVRALSEGGDKRASHHSFDYIICHSNGCTGAIAAVMSGDISVKHIFAMGTDWTTASLDPRKLHGTDITFFVNRTDPVPWIPAVSVQRVTDRTPGLGFTLYFGNIKKDLPSQLGNLIGENQPDTVRYAVVRMDPRPGLMFFDAHRLPDSYLSNVHDWMSRKGEEQEKIRTLLNLPPNFRVDPPTRASSQSYSAAGTPRSTNTRGGVSADIKISDSDFALKKGDKK